MKTETEIENMMDKIEEDGLAYSSGMLDALRWVLGWDEEDLV